MSGGWICATDISGAGTDTEPLWISLNGNTTSNESINGGNVHVSGNLSSGTSRASGKYTVALGRDNNATDNFAVVSGGFDNAATRQASTISGGYKGKAAGDYSTVSGGLFNNASGYASVVVGGENCIATGASSISGGYYAFAGNSSAIALGNYSRAMGVNSIALGYKTNATADKSLALGSDINNNQNASMLVGFGGQRFIVNTSGIAFFGDIMPEGSLCLDGKILKRSGGIWTCADDDTTGGTALEPLWISVNSITTSNASINGGNVNVSGSISMATSRATGNYSVALGFGNNATGNYAVVSGGQGNLAGNNWTVVAGGRNNRANSSFAVVSGGENNTAEANYSVVSGGLNNHAEGMYSSIPGGYRVNATGNYSMAAGYNVSAGGSTSKDYTFAFGMNFINSQEKSFMVGFDDPTLIINDSYVRVEGDLNVTGVMHGMISNIYVPSLIAGDTACGRLNGLVSGWVYTCVDCLGTDAVTIPSASTGGGCSAGFNNPTYCACRVI
ncbi:MAG: hypothetical protein V1875_07965 [Candidatus Altiarchaeota archaeon]